MSERLAAAKVLLRVFSGESLSRALPEVLKSLAPKSQPVVQALVYGTLRLHEKLSAILDLLLRHPIKQKDAIVDALLRVALFECLDKKTATYAVVNETVKVAGKQRAWSRGLVNACLRRFLRETDTLLNKTNAISSAHHCLPDWLLARLQQDWPSDWEDITSASSEHPPLVIRVNTEVISRQDYLESLTEQGISALFHPDVATAIIISEAVSVDSLPGFEEGRVSVQGAASQLAVLLLDLSDGMRVLDACAAPGGKTLHILQTNNVELIALDKQEVRLENLKSNLKRGGKEAIVLVAAAEKPDLWWDGKSFDRILLDAPCSATGVIRKHPDIKLHRTSDDINSLVSQQKRLLETLWRVLKPGGLLVYSTCSILHVENEQQIESFLADTKDARVEKINMTLGRKMNNGIQILPGDNDLDGFYYARLRKQQSGIV